MGLIPQNKAEKKAPGHAAWKLWDIHFDDSFSVIVKKEPVGTWPLLGHKSHVVTAINLKFREHDIYVITIKWYV